MLGGKLMDIFVDKLAQKLTAQDMIKANAAADADEIRKLKNQMEKYNECLAQMEALNKEMLTVSQRMNKMSELIPELGLMVNENWIPQMNQLMEESKEKIREFQQDGQAIEELQNNIHTRLAETEEFVHKENVKVYRNVQAVVLEEAKKQTEVVEQVTNLSAGKIKAILGVSIGALVVTLGSVVFQVLVYLHII